MIRTIQFFLLFHLISLSVFAQIATQKTLLAAKETGIFNTGQASALNTRTGQTLVIWQRVSTTKSVIVGRIINNQGKTATSQFELTTTVGAAHPSVAYNPVRNEFMLAFDNNPNVQLSRSSVVLRRLNAQGRAAGQEVVITSDAVSTEMANFFPKIVFNPQTHGYTVAWLREITTQSQADDGTNGLVAALVSGGGGTIGTIRLIQQTLIEQNRIYGPVTMDHAYHPANGKYLLLFVQVIPNTNGTQANYFMGTFDPSLNGISASNIAKVNSAAVQLVSGFVWGARLALFADTPGLVFFVDTSNIKRRKIDLLGKLTGGASVAFKPPKNNTRLTYPAVAFATNAKGTRGLLVAVQDAFRETGEASTWAQKLNASGLPDGVPVRVDVTTTTDTSLSGILTALPHKGTDTLFRFISYYTLAQFTTPGQTFQNSGIVKLNLDLAIP